MFPAEKRGSIYQPIGSKWQDAEGSVCYQHL
jgi:hypothetical protein